MTMGYPLSVFENPNSETHKKLFKILTEMPHAITTVEELFNILYISNKAGIKPIIVFGMNRSIRNGIPSNETMILLVPTMFGVVKFTTIIEEIGFNRKSWAYRDSPLDRLRYHRGVEIDGKLFRFDDFKVEKIFTYGSYY
jgi:hypothetical protein